MLKNLFKDISQDIFFAFSTLSLISPKISQKIILNSFLKISLKIFPVLFLHYLAETKLGVPLLTMIRFDPDLQDILELDFPKKGFQGKYFCLNLMTQNIEDWCWQVSKQLILQT